MTIGLVLSLIIPSLGVLHCICASALCILFVQPNLSVNFLLIYPLDVCMSFVCNWLLKYLMFLYLACLAILDHFRELQKFCTISVVLCLNVTLQMHIWGIIILLYVVRTALLFFVAANCWVFYFSPGNKVLKIWYGNIFPSIFMLYNCTILTI